MSEKLFSVLDSLLRSYREPIPHTFALLAKNLVAISEGHGWMSMKNDDGSLRNECRGLPLYVKAIHAANIKMTPATIFASYGFDFLHCNDGSEA